MKPVACLVALLAASSALAQESDLMMKEVVEIAGITYAVPTGWVVEEPKSSAMIRRLAQFRLPRAEGDDADGQLVAIQAGGSVEANLERWRAQFSSTDAEQAKGSTVEVEVAGIRATVLTVYGTYSVPPFLRKGDGPAEQPGQGMIGVVLETEPQMTFFKVTGGAATIEAHRAAVLELLASGRTGR